jgi:acetone carboxylase gamma subunit
MCSYCGHVFCLAADNPKLCAKMSVGLINDLSHPSGQMTRIDLPRFFFRHFYCPSCGLAFDSEVARPEDQILHSIEYDSDWLGSVEATSQKEAQ